MERETIGVAMGSGIIKEKIRGHPLFLLMLGPGGDNAPWRPLSPPEDGEPMADGLLPVASFVRTVWTMVTNEEETLIAWSPDGARVIADPPRFGRGLPATSATTSGRPSRAS
ncbi:hypothetical protein SO694_00008590 [Aureococcus anophagefferens]|uniref:Anaphase-promoting complex subunit 4 WD40 domain-containing protein n=1 Tax=Aureococcus anophagefferens TaxID=44056 RepID=A0ABR1GDY4_AURAN